MRKFIVYTRPVLGHSKENDLPTIIEVEGEIISGVEDPSALSLPEGEFWFRIVKPEFLYELRELNKSKEKIMIPPVYYSHSVFWTTHQAMASAIKIVKDQFEYIKRKTNTDFTEEQVSEKCKEIQEILL